MTLAKTVDIWTKAPFNVSPVKLNKYGVEQVLTAGMFAGDSCHECYQFLGSSLKLLKDRAM